MGRRTFHNPNNFHLPYRIKLILNIGLGATGLDLNLVLPMTCFATLGKLSCLSEASSPKTDTEWEYYNNNNNDNFFPSETVEMI